MERDRILVVDDDSDNRAMIGHFLENWGYAVEDATDGRNALEKAKANPPALVLLDLEMPEMDGIETCKRLKTDPETEWIPVIIFSGLESVPQRIRGLQHGADDYVQKTVEPDELRTRIDVALRRAKKYATLFTPLPAVIEAAAEPAVVPEPPPKVEAKAAPELALSLSLARVPFPEAMKLVLAHGKNGIAHLEGGAESGAVHVRDGAVTHAVVGDRKGSEAFYELALWKNGKLDFEEVDPSKEKTILTSTRSLLVEANRRHEAWSAIGSKVKSFDLIPKWISLPSGSIRLTAADWAMLRLMNGRLSIREIVEELQSDLFQAGRVVHNLLTVGVLRLDESADNHDEGLEKIPRRGDASLAGEPFELTAGEWDVLSRVDGARTLAAIAEAANLNGPELLEMVASLEKRGFLELDSSEARKQRPSER
jgi:CheY-like chemotaxis protein